MEYVLNCSAETSKQTIPGEPYDVIPIWCVFPFEPCFMDCEKPFFWDYEVSWSPLTLMPIIFVMRIVCCSGPVESYRVSVCMPACFGVAPSPAWWWILLLYVHMCIYILILPHVGKANQTVFLISTLYGIETSIFAKLLFWHIHWHHKVCICVIWVYFVVEGLTKDGRMHLSHRWNPPYQMTSA